MIFPPAFLDSSSWNDNQQQQAHHHQVAAAGGGDGNSNHELIHHQHQQQPPIMGAAGGGSLPDGGGGGGGQGQLGPAKPMSMAERARLARIPLPEPGLKCPRCDSTNTKFCYFNNYSLSQPRHFCRACRRYWTRGGALRNVPVGGGYRRHAKRAKPKQQQQQQQAASGVAAAATATAGPGGGSSTTSSASASACGTTTSGAHGLPGAHAMLGGSLSMLPPLLRLSDFDAMSLGSSCFSGMGGKPGAGAAASIDAYSSLVGGGGGAPGGLEHQWRVQQMQSFPFLHAIDQGPPLGPPLAMTMAPGMFQLGLDTSDGGGRGGGAGAGGGGEDGQPGDHQPPLHHVMQTKRESYPAARGLLYGGDHHHHHLAAAAGYTSYSTNAATGNHLL